MKAALIVSHGSHSPKTKVEVVSLIAELKKNSPVPIWEFAFLEIEQPSIPGGIGVCVERGATEIVVLLNFLNSGKHVDEDIPRIILEQKNKFPEVKIRITSPVGQHKEIAELFLDLLGQA